MVFVGYPYNCEEDLARMCNPDTNGVITTWDVIWLKTMFHEIPNETSEIVQILEQSSESEDLVDNVEKVPSADINNGSDGKAGAGGMLFSTLQLLQGLVECHGN